MDVSVIVPLYNKGKEIGRALDSIARQRIAPSEVIVIDDGSTDGGADIVRSSGLPNLRLICQANAGECAARNRGIQEARESLVAFLDADDTWEPGFLDAIATMWRKYPTCGLYGTAWQVCAADGKLIVPSFRKVPPRESDGILDSYFASASRGACICGSAAASPKRVLEEVGGFPRGVKLAGDRETWLRIAVDYPVAFCNKILATWHLGASNRSSVLYKVGRGQAIVQTGLRILSRADLSPQVQRDLTAYIARTQIFTAKWAIREGNPKEARKVLFECVNPRAFRWQWAACMTGSFLPRTFFTKIYALRCRTLEWIEKVRRSDSTSRPSP